MHIKTAADSGTKFEVLVQGKYYRVTNITRITRVKQLTEDLQFQFVNLLPEEGLNIEEKCKDGKHYIVVNTLYYDKGHKGVELTDIYCRSIDVLNYQDENIETYFERTQEYCNCLEFAKKALLDIWEEKETSDNNNLIFDRENQTVTYKGFKVKLLEDDYGQQLYFYFNDKEYSCGAFNPCPELEVQAIIDNYLREKGHENTNL